MIDSPFISTSLAENVAMPSVAVAKGMAGLMFGFDMAAALAKRVITASLKRAGWIESLLGLGGAVAEQAVNARRNKDGNFTGEITDLSWISV